MLVMARHGRSTIFSGVVRHRAVVGLFTLCGVGALFSAWTHRDNRETALLWLGLGVFILSVTVIVASLSIGPRPLRSFGVGVWLLVTATGASLVWLGRSSVEVTRVRDELIPPFMLVLAIALVPLALWMMIWRPEQGWEKEVRFERERNRQHEPEES